MFGELPVATLADDPRRWRGRRRRGVAGTGARAGDHRGQSAGVGAGRGAAGGGGGALDFRVAVDPYVNATTRLADVICRRRRRWSARYDVALYQLAVRNAHLLGADLRAEDGRPAEWEILLTLAKGLMGWRRRRWRWPTTWWCASWWPGAGGSDRGRDVSGGRRGGGAGGAGRAARTGAGGRCCCGWGRTATGSARAAGLTLDGLAAKEHGVIWRARAAVAGVLRTGDGRIDLAPARSSAMSRGWSARSTQRRRSWC
jgi:hypothetical protein